MKILERTQGLTSRMEDDMNTMSKQSPRKRRNFLQWFSELSEKDCVKIMKFVGLISFFGIVTFTYFFRKEGLSVIVLMVIIGCYLWLRNSPREN